MGGYAQRIAGIDTIYIKVLNRKANVLYGVHIQSASSGILMATTNEDGIAAVAVKTLQQEKKLLFHSLGFKTKEVAVEDLKENNLFTLTEESFGLDEVVVRGVNLNGLLKNARDNGKRSDRKWFPSIYEQYFGEGQYMKITECLGKTVEFRREYGCFLTTGNIKRNWDNSTTEKTFEDLEEDKYEQKFFTGDGLIGTTDQMAFREEVNNEQYSLSEIFSHYSALRAVFDRVLERKDISPEFINRILSYRMVVNTFDKYDMEYDFSFIPVYTQRSLCWDAGGTDTLPVLYNNLFDSGSNKLYTIMRCIYLFGPVFTSPGDFTFELVGGDNVKEYAVDFETKKGRYPKRTDLVCKGRLWIDRGTRRLTRMNFDYFYYYRYRLVDVFGQHSPFETAVLAEFDYDDEGVCYIKSCKAATCWTAKEELGDSKVIFTVEAPSRPFPEEVKLVEMEGFRAYSFKRIPKPLQTKQVGEDARVAAKNPVGEYRKEVLDTLPFLWKCVREMRDLHQLMPVQEQFQLNSQKNYYLQDAKYFSTQECVEARKRILDVFWKEE